MNLRDFLLDRIRQLQDRQMMIPRYLKKEGQFLGRKDFSLDDLPKIEKDIAETKAALKGLDDYRKANKLL